MIQLTKLRQPLPNRIFHWVQFFAVIILTFTGFYLAAPYENLVVPMRTVRKLHFLFGFIFIFNFILYVYYYVATKTYKDVLFLPSDVKNLPSLFKYIFFLTSTHPPYGKYNPGQKLLFTLWFLTNLATIISGLILYAPDFFVQIHPIFRMLNTYRVIIYLGSVVFAVTVPLHLYLVLTEDMAKLQAIFTGKIKVK
ncbi:cytochrome b/b6 domain-containing protein [Calderihabitans maritimus]|uniref:Iron hydrogenase n=1 Tax=Calderihabitans maritimus TaxID=1246530 RepID=A0A1Z5HNV3_9FIRM|nr:cytochrome b/b6 domain-containing protein [Calderihabitans maritimus]GAW91212.1 iron hydrogenase [Calderihabitans maritimus]